MVATQLTEESTSKYVQAGDIRLHYNEAGAGDVVIMIHGGGPGASGWSNYATNIAPFAEKYRTLLVDMPGYGKSDARVAEDWRNRMNARALKDMLDALGIEKAHFVGNSMGGATSATFAIMYPERINKLVLMGAGGGGASIAQPLPQEGIKVLNEVFAEPTLENFRKLINIFVYDSSFMTDDLLMQRVNATLAHPEHLDARKKSRPGLEDLTPELDKIKAQTLVIWGRDDRFAPLDHALKFIWHIPNANAHVFSKCGHWAQYEKSDEFNRMVLDFLAN
jgi:2-hydroxy-6-oxonona-2,4-dienedioate hydrolase